MESTDIESVLKASEALLQRLQSSDEQEDASMASIQSSQLRRNSGASSLTFTVDQSHISLSRQQQQELILDDSSLADLIVKDPLQTTDEKITQGVYTQEKSQASSTQWEKVSTANEGDDDYVPIVDYTKHSSKQSSANHNFSSNMRLDGTDVGPRRTRLEIYRASRKRKRKLQRQLAIVSALFVLLVLFFHRHHFTTPSLDNAGYISAQLQSNLTVEAESCSCLVPSLQFTKAVVDDLVCQNGGQMQPSDGFSGTRPVSSVQSPSCKNPLHKLFNRECRQQKKHSFKKLVDKLKRFGKRQDGMGRNSGVERRKENTNKHTRARYDT